MKKPEKIEEKCSTFSGFSLMLFRNKDYLQFLFLQVYSFSRRYSSENWYIYLLLKLLVRVSL